MTILVDREIEELATTTGLIVDFEKDSIQGASYDLRLGHQFVRNGKIESLTENAPTLVLRAGEFAVLRSYEELNMPTDLIGHNGIMSPWAKRGLVSLFSPQIDPGFRGFLVVPVFNAGDAPVSINLRQRIFTVEFARTAFHASYSWSDRYGVQNKLEVPHSPSLLKPENSANLKIEDELQVLKSDFKVLSAKFDQSNDARKVSLTKLSITITLIGLGVALGNSAWFRETAIPLIMSFFAAT